MSTRVSSVLFLVLAILPAAADDLTDYVAAPDASYRWKIESEFELAGARGFQVSLTSQTWRGIAWEHWLTVLEPAEVDHPDAAVLVVNGGRNSKDVPRLNESAMYLVAVAQKMRCPVAVLSQVPNQPLFDGRREDALIAHTFDRFLDSGEKDWPLLLPMTKSAVRAMDAVQAVVREKFGREVRRFCVTGGSKRGWTTWLAGAVDRRVAAIAPMVIDTLNMREQMRHQILSWGDFSPEIKDYTDLDLPRRMDADPRSRELIEAVDPYSHRARIDMPKLILIGTNDPYWPIDAARFYFDDLVGESFLHYVPNAGHGLNLGVADTISAFFRSVLAGRPRPRLAWRSVERADGAVLAAIPSAAPREVRLWTAGSASRDFRGSKWTSRPAPADETGAWTVRVPRPEKEGDHAAFFLEFVFGGEGEGAWSAATRVEVLSGGVR